MINAAITPGIHPQIVNSKVIIIDPQPLSITASGGKIIARITLNRLMSTGFIDKTFAIDVTVQ